MAGSGGRRRSGGVRATRPLVVLLLLVLPSPCSRPFPADSFPCPSPARTSAAHRAPPQEHGWSGIEVSRASDCWVRDVAFVNADNGVLVDGADRVTLRGLQLSVTRSRAGGPEGKEGHWGVRVGETATADVTWPASRGRRLQPLP